MNVLKYKNIIDSEYKKLSQSQKKNLINEFANDIFNELGIPQKYYPKIRFSSKYYEEHAGAFSNIDKLNPFNRNGVIYLSKDVFLNCQYSDNNSIARLLFRAIHHEGIHCMQKLIREDKVEPNKNYNFLSTITDLKAQDYKVQKTSIESETGKILINNALSYILCDLKNQYLEEKIGRMLYYTQLKEWDAFSQTDNRTIPFLQNLYNFFSNDFSNEDLKQLKKSIYTHSAVVEEKNDFISRQLLLLDYCDLNSFLSDQATVCRAIFCNIAEDVEKAKLIEQEHPVFYHHLLKAYQASYNVWKNKSISFNYLEDNKDFSHPQSPQIQNKHTDNPLTEFTSQMSYKPTWTQFKGQEQIKELIELENEFNIRC